MNSSQSKPLPTQPSKPPIKQTRVPVRVPTNLRSSNLSEPINQDTLTQKNVRRIDTQNLAQNNGDNTPTHLVPKPPKKTIEETQQINPNKPSSLNKKPSMENNSQTQGIIPEKSQTTASTRIKLNLSSNKPKPQNIFHKDLKSQIFKDLDKNKVENESLINNPTTNNVPTKKFDPSVRMRIVHQQNHQSPGSTIKNQAQQEPEIEENIESPLNKHYDYQEDVRNLRECQSIELEDSVSSPGIQRNKDRNIPKSPNHRTEEEKKEVQPNVKLERPPSGIRVRKGQFIIQTKVTISTDKMAKEGFNNVQMHPSKVGLGKSEFIGTARKTEEVLNKEIPMQKSNIYADIKNSKGQPIVESLYSEQDMKRLSLSHKMKGNEYYKLGNYEKAVEEYSKAIKLYSKDSTYYSNRAVCYKLLIQWDKVVIDCELSFTIDDKNFKAANLMGHALVELGKKDKDNKKIKRGIESLEKAMKIYSDKGEVGDVSIKNELETKVQKARKIDWLKDYQTKKSKKEGLMDFVNGLIDKDTKSKNKLKFDPKEAFNKFCKENSFNEQAEVPEYFCCKITFEIMKDPVLTPYGIGYEKSVIVEHFKKNGNFDPVTRRPITVLVPNVSLLRAIQTFIKQNPWAYEFVDVDEDYHKISL